jgi:hypothetical protein
VAGSVQSKKAGLYMAVQREVVAAGPEGGLRGGSDASSWQVQSKKGGALHEDLSGSTPRPTRVNVYLVAIYR